MTKYKKRTTKRSARPSRGSDDHMPPGLEAVAFMNEWAANENLDEALFQQGLRHKGGKPPLTEEEIALIRATLQELRQEWARKHLGAELLASPLYGWVVDVCAKKGFHVSPGTVWKYDPNHKPRKRRKRRP